jgi:hypothetical protein
MNWERECQHIYIAFINGHLHFKERTKKLGNFSSPIGPASLPPGAASHMWTIDSGNRIPGPWTSLEQEKNQPHIDRMHSFSDTVPQKVHVVVI